MLVALPMIFVLAGLVLYVVLGGADFGAAFWQTLAGRGPDAPALRERAHESMAPVWEANHVWLIFVLTVLWTAYPVAFGSIASTLGVALFLAALGIIARGAAYALRTATSVPAQVRAIDAISAGSSVLTPFALGAAVGGIASGRVPVGNAQGDLFTSWLNPTGILVGVLAVVLSAYQAAVFLSADTVRTGEPRLAEAYRRRALATAVLAGLVAIVGLGVVRADARPLFDGLTSGAGLAGLGVSVAAGAVTLVLLWRRHMESARYASAVAVAGVVAGWALAQQPEVLPGLSLRQAAAPDGTLVAVVVAVLAGAVILFPSLGILFRLALGGRLGEGEEASDRAEARRTVVSASAPGLLGRVALGCFLAGVGLLTLAEAGWAHGVGATALVACVALGFLSLAPGTEA